MAKEFFCVAIFLILFSFFGCSTKHEVELKPVEIKPIHITIDVNVRVEKALDNFFDDLEKAEDQIKE